MEADRPVAIVDTSVIIALSVIGAVPLLERLFRVVHIPMSVWHELIARPSAPEPAALRELTHFAVVLDAALYDPRLLALGRGERQVIALASLHKWVPLLDEKVGRRLARGFELAPVGTLGVLRAAKEVGALPLLRPAIEQLLAAGFRLDRRLADELLVQAQEPPLAT